MKQALVFAALAAAVPAQNWSLMSPVTSPGLRRAGAMAFDGVSNKLIMFGGLSVSPTAILNQTWSYGGATPNWAQLTVGGNPPARWGHRMVRNLANNRLITFGGRSPNVGNFASDTWEFTGTLTGGSWAQVNTAAHPSARYLYGLAWDEARNVAVLFGGSSATQTFGDTWEYDGTNWTLRQITGATPPPREDMVLVYDAALNRTVLFGGYDTVNGVPLGDTWLYDGTRWVQQPGIQSPSARYSSSAVYDSVRKRIVLFGGYDDLLPALWERDTWEFAGGAWNQLTITSSLPQNSSEAYFGYDPNRKKLVLHGGFGGVFLGETWELNTPTGTAAGQTGIFGTFEPGCSQDTPGTVACTTPTIGATANITYGNLQPNALFVAAVLGFSNRTFGAIPLPLDLGPVLGGVGLPTTCALRVAADNLGSASTPASGSAVFPLPLPTNNNLIGVVFYTQGLVVIDAGGTLAVESTAAGRGVVGN